MRISELAEIIMRNTAKYVVAASFSFFLLPSSAQGAFKEGAWVPRPAGMGGAFIAVSDDACAPLYNPAGLSQIRDVEAGFMYSRLFASLEGVDLGVKNAVVAVPTREWGNFGFGWKSFASNNEYQEDTVYISYAQPLNGTFSAGANIKYLGHRYILDDRSRTDSVFSESDSKYQITGDIGVLAKINVKSVYEVLCIGLSVKNLTQPDLGLKSEDRVPSEFGLGLAYRINNDVITACDITYRAQSWGQETDKVTYRIGEERWFLGRLLAVRYGGNTHECTAGVSFKPRISNTDFQLDYSFIMPFELKETQGSHHISLSVRFIDLRDF